MAEKPTYLRMPTVNDAPYFLSASCAELIVDALMSAQRREWLQLHAFNVLPNVVELIATPLKQDIMGVKEFLQAQTAPLLAILLPKAAEVWDRRFIVKWLDSQRALDLQFDIMRYAPVEYRLVKNPSDYAYSFTHPRYHGLIKEYTGFETEAAWNALTRVHVAHLPEKRSVAAMLAK